MIGLPDQVAAVELVDASRGTTPGRLWLATMRPPNRRALIHGSFIPDEPWRAYCRRWAYWAQFAASTHPAYRDPAGRPTFPGVLSDTAREIHRRHRALTRIEQP